VKLRQNGIVSLMIRPAVFLAGSRAYMKLHGMTNDGIASRNLFLKQTEYIYSMFDVGRSMFDVHHFLSRSDWPLAARGSAHMKLQRNGFDFI